ncbi:unnamed protein product [Mycena citricolor]|uniref:SH3 domain-containing protein n=1 Tax=Mycena citricolor TaxID=2018698 RepID=A0AAD2H9F5_9AGAR|nr:unnamed protein product [Mycena citricolor]
MSSSRSSSSPVSRQRLHRVVRHALAPVERDTLGIRAPALINLPLPIPTLPIVAGVLTDLIAGLPGPSSTVTPPGNTPTTPASTPTTAAQPPSTSTAGSGSASSGSGAGSSGSGSGAGSSSGSGTGSSSGSGSSTGSGSGTGSGTGTGSSAGSVSGSGSGSGSSSGSGSASSSGSDSSNNTPPASGSGSGSGPGSGAASGSSSSSSSSPASGGSGSGNAIASGASTGSSTSGAAATGATGTGSSASSASLSGTAGGSSAADQGSVASSKQGSSLVNVVSNPDSGVSSAAVAHPTGSTSYFVQGSKTIAVVGTVTFSDGLPTSSATVGSSGGTTGSNGSPNGGTSAGNTPARGTPKFVYPLVGVVGTIIVIASILSFFRRRAVHKRQERRKWWSSANWTEQPRDSGVATVGRASSSRSIRSSFGTAFDHSEFSLQIDDNAPAVPPMVEIRGGPATVPKGDSSLGGRALSPISPVSPSSPSNPVALLISIENSNVFSDQNRRVSAGSLTSTTSSNAQFLTYDRPANNQLVTPDLVVTPMSVRPFSPSESFAFPAPPRERRSNAWTGTGSLRVSTSMPILGRSSLAAEDAFAGEHRQGEASSLTDNPFADPAAIAAATAFDAVETVSRPFAQTLQDEITVQTGDKVKVLAIYDDGWAMVDKLAPGGERAEMGLIPVDCMRRTEETVAAFVEKKRLSAVNATGYAAM